MSWDGRDHRKSRTAHSLNSFLPFSPRIILGALAIALIVLAFALGPGQLPQDDSRVAPEAEPTHTSAAVAGLSGVAPPAPATLVPTAPAAPSKERIHTVGSGDTLTSIAKQYYGDASKWQKILDANKDVLKSPDNLELGQKLKIPE